MCVSVCVACVCGVCVCVPICLTIPSGGKDAEQPKLSHVAGRNAK